MNFEVNEQTLIYANTWNDVISTRNFSSNEKIKIFESSRHELQLYITAANMQLSVWTADW
jgi:hypothetical protein